MFNRITGRKWIFFYFTLHYRDITSIYLYHMYHIGVKYILILEDSFVEQ